MIETLKNSKGTGQHMLNIIYADYLNKQVIV
ncbi:uncharacterized protein METZ01_LOCUS143255 [marine metagenome]|uniref:Uncharacterized protein n=1 Tax=marine metagenome TaxID=408172 RepID=A0A381ZN78_9ZZZZ